MKAIIIFFSSFMLLARTAFPFQLTLDSVNTFTFNGETYDEFDFAYNPYTHEGNDGPFIHWPTKNTITFDIIAPVIKQTNQAAYAING